MKEEHEESSRRAIDERLHRAVDGELSDAESRALDEALDREPELRGELTELESLRDLISDVGSSPRFEAAPEGRAPLHVGLRRFTSFAAAAAVLLLAGVLVLRTDRDRTSPDGVEPVGPDAPAASLEMRVAEGEASPMVVPLPSRQPDVHIFWVYPFES